MNQSKARRMGLNVGGALLAALLVPGAIGAAQRGAATQPAAAGPSKVQALLERMTRELEELDAAVAGLNQALAPEPASSSKTPGASTRQSATPQQSSSGSAGAHTGKYYIKGSTHAYTKHELTHIVQQRGASLPEIADEVLVAFGHGDAAAKQAAGTPDLPRGRVRGDRKWEESALHDLQAAARRLAAAAKKLAAARDPNAERVALGELKLAVQTTQQHCQRVAKIDALAIKQQ